MSILRAIWNGPFYAGPLVRPVSVGDAILKLLETIWRASVAIIALAAGLGAVALGWVYAIEPVFFPPASSKVKISAEFDDGSKFIVSTVPPPSPKELNQ